MEQETKVEYIDDYSLIDHTLKKIEGYKQLLPLSDDVEIKYKNIGATIKFKNFDGIKSFVEQEGKLIGYTVSLKSLFSGIRVLYEIAYLQDGDIKYTYVQESEICD